MRKFCISFLIVAIIILTGIGQFIPNTRANAEYLRIHVRANSNQAQDQEVKYLIKDEVVKYLTPYLAECTTRAQALECIEQSVKELESVANAVLNARGFDYVCKASVKREQFPTRTYQNLVLEKGFYDALILELGSASGDNWWCVVYPPLCFTQGNGNYVYRSKIKEIIADFFKKEKKQ